MNRRPTALALAVGMSVAAVGGLGLLLVRANARQSAQEQRIRALAAELEASHAASALAASPLAAIATRNLDPVPRLAAVEQRLDELLALAKSGSEKAAQPEREPAPAPTPEATATRQKAEELVDRTLASGNWSAADRDALRPLLDAADAATRDALMNRIYAALNSGKIRPVRLHGPPL